jgi:hypothetical protein
MEVGDQLHALAVYSLGMRPCTYYIREVEGFDSRAGEDV